MTEHGWWTGVVRLPVLLAVTVGTGLGVGLLSEPSLRRALGTVAAGASPAVLPLDVLVAAGCAASLVACWAWLAVCAWIVAVRALTGRRGAGRPRGCPRLVSSVVLALLGVTALSLPASAADSGATPGVTGLPLPDRVAAAPVAAAAPVMAVQAVRVRPGDSLWRIAARLCPEQAADATVDRTWRRLAAANRDRLGPDPDLIFPGTLLRVPAGSALRKDSS